MPITALLVSATPFLYVTRLTPYLCSLEHMSLIDLRAICSPRSAPRPDARRRIGVRAGVGGRRVAADDGGRAAEDPNGRGRGPRGAGGGGGALRRRPRAADRGDRRRHRRVRQVVAAYKLPKASADEQAARKAAIQQALRAATDVPLGVDAAVGRGARVGDTIAAHGHRAAASDVGVAVALLRAGARGARLNVEINLGTASQTRIMRSDGPPEIAQLPRRRRGRRTADALLRDSAPARSP